MLQKIILKITYNTTREAHKELQKGVFFKVTA